MSPYVLFTLLAALGLGTAVTFASSHWLLAWMGLEINMLAILPLMARQHTPRAVEATTKYFLAQAAAAATLLFAALTNAHMTGQWEISQVSHPLPATMVMTALALKVGLAPVHAWLPEVLQGLDLTTGMILSTWQKLAPFALLAQMEASGMATPLVAMGVVSMLVGGLGGLNQTQLRKILAYSSIAHMGWMVVALQFSPSLSLLALALYLAMTISMFKVFQENQSTTINHLALSWAKTPILAVVGPLTLLSMGGLPPLTGFMSKWLILDELSKQGLPALATVSALSALLSLYFYLRVNYAMALTMPPNNLSGTAPWRLPPQQMGFAMATSTGLSLGLLPLAPKVLALFAR
uniref:NADH-ubiquinone oxidoreductase chain 2 n=1 Tax=Laeops lanceolata TaxID=1497103 RepID=A0A090ARA8_9PLEU|nr:NADH dehydrogenase subunit 2 [Laeops lanceolata]BAP58952.1 NADH dehydrogenase subunit 2 [Laeops lanceolata]